MEQVREALRAGADVNEQDEDGWTALMRAVECGGEHGAGMMRLLVDAGADANKQNKCGWTALMHTAKYGGEHGAGMMRLLVDVGADANKQNNDGWTALMLAARSHCSESDDEYACDDSTSDGSESDATDRGEHSEAMVRLLVTRGATLPRAADALHRNTPSALVSYLDGARSWTPLHRAADARDHDALVALLGERPPSFTRPDEAVDSPHPHMRTALSIAGSDSYPTARPCLLYTSPSPRDRG